MTRIMTRLALGAGLAALPAIASAEPACSKPVLAPAPFTKWSYPMKVKAGVGIEKASKIMIGMATDAILLRSSDVRYVVKPEKEGDGRSNGGLLALKIGRVGTYRIGLSTGAWVDIVSKGKSVASTAHTHGVPCSPVVKIVDFALQPGNYTLQLSATPQMVVRVMVVGIY